jgi:drug/metabolite transporter (DMT)-like permease
LGLSARSGSYHTSARSGVFVNLEPLVGAILGFSLLHEVLGKMALAGGALIIGGAIYFSYKPEAVSHRGRADEDRLG